MPKTKQLKREEAEARREARDKRSPLDQVSRLYTRPGVSAREIARLQPVKVTNDHEG